MPRRTKSQPGYLHHKPSNQAYVRVNGRMVYLGVYDTAESHRRYAATIADLSAGIPIEDSPRRTDARPLTVGELAEQYLNHEEDRFGPRNKQTHAAKYAMLALVKNHAGLRADQFRPKALRRIQQDLVKQGYARREVNERVNRIRAAFRWAVAEELIEVSILESLKTLARVPRGQARENKPREAVDPKLVDETVKELMRTGLQGAALLTRFLRWTGCRPGEGCELTVSDISLNASQPVAHLLKHKTMKHTGMTRKIPLNLQAVEAIEEACALLTSIAPDEPLFHSTRGEAYTANGLYQAIKRTCMRAGLEQWSPYQLRHLAATEVLAATGNETVAAAMLGHSPQSKVIRRYSTDRFKLASDAAHALGGAS